MKINIRNILEDENKIEQDVVEETTESPEEEEAETEVNAEEIDIEQIDEPEAEEVEDQDCEMHDSEGSISKANFWKLYGSIVAIGAVMVLLLICLVVYTTMIPRQVNAIIDGKQQEITTYEYTVAGFLEDQGVSYCEEDYMSVPPTGYIHDGIKFEMIHATDFEVIADGKTVAYKSLESTIEAALKDVGVKLRDRDIVIPKREAELKQDAKIVVKRVEIEKKTVTEKVKFETVEKDDPEMNEGETKVVTKGKNGQDKVVYEITYIDGKESKRKELSRKVIEKPINKVIANGTRINYNGKSYSRKLVVKAYSYTGGGTTAMGTRARVGEIAVDPSVIPLGTNVYIEGVGPRRAEDTGGNIKGNTIDIYMNSLSECRSWGVRYVTVYIE